MARVSSRRYTWSAMYGFAIIAPVAIVMLSLRLLWLHRTPRDQPEAQG